MWLKKVPTLRKFHIAAMAPGKALPMSFHFMTLRGASCLIQTVTSLLNTLACLPHTLPNCWAKWMSSGIPLALALQVFHWWLHLDLSFFVGYGLIQKQGPEWWFMWKVDLYWFKTIWQYNENVKSWNLWGYVLQQHFLVLHPWWDQLQDHMQHLRSPSAQ